MTSHHGSTKSSGTGHQPPHPPTASALLWTDGQELHPRLEALLLRVQAAERTAVGPHRRPTFRLMREVLGASVRLGVPPQLLADCLRRTRDSVRNRATELNGTVSAELVRQLTGLNPAQLDRLSGGELTRHAEHADQRTFLIADLVRALLNTPWPRAKSVAARSSVKAAGPAALSAKD